MSDETTTNRKGDYEVLSVLGAGGMGQVFKVRNVLSGRVEAMKVLLPDLANQKDLADRFLKEIRVLAGLHHPNIAELRTALTIENRLVMIMEYVEGSTLGARLQQGPIPCADAARFADQVLAALSYAHRQQIVHRDIKPANMMLTPEHAVKLMDFGIARSGTDRGLTMTGTTLGSVAYMSPEQVRCESIDARSDLYSVGVSLYEMATGKKPFDGENHFAVMKAHLEETPTAPDQLNPAIPHAFSGLILMAMAKDPARRFQSADAFRGALHAVVPELGEIASVGSAGPAIAQPATSVEKIGSSALSPTIPITAVPGTSRQVQPPTAANVATVVAAAPRAQAPANHRGLYVTLGALVVVFVLVVAGAALPRWQHTRASGEPFFHWKKAAPGAVSSPPSSPVTSSPGPSALPPTNDAAEQRGVTSSGPPTTPVLPSAAPVHPVAHTTDVISKAAPTAAPETPAQTAAAAAQAQAKEAALQIAEHDLDLLSSRAATITTSLTTLEREQQAQGYSLRGDIADSRTRMQLHLEKAANAIQSGDADSAKKYMDLAEPEVEKIEKFLGR